MTTERRGSAEVIDLGEARDRKPKSRHREAAKRRVHSPRRAPRSEEGDFYWALGQRLRLERMRRGWTQYDVQRKTRIHHQALCRYETARSRVPIHVLAQLAALYGKSLAELVPS